MRSLVANDTFKMQGARAYDAHHGDGMLSSTREKQPQTRQGNNFRDKLPKRSESTNLQPPGRRAMLPASPGTGAEPRASTHSFPTPWASGPPISAEACRFTLSINCCSVGPSAVQDTPSHATPKQGRLWAEGRVVRPMAKDEAIASQSATSCASHEDEVLLE